jgi:4'-phosphopantetheinyl transferase EntD
VAGSLSHGGGMVAAAASFSPAIAALGIDIEPLAPRADSLATAICTPDEALAARRHDHGILRAFSAKEAAFKALYPLTLTLFGFETLTVTLRQGGFTARLATPLGPLEPGWSLEGGQAVAQGFILSAAVITREMWPNQGTDFVRGNVTFP